METDWEEKISTKLNCQAFSLHLQSAPDNLSILQHWRNRKSEPIRRKFIDQRLVVCLSSEKMRKIAKGLQNFFNGPRCVHSAENLNSILEKKLL